MGAGRVTAVALACVMGVFAGCGERAGSASLDELLARGWRAYSTGDFDFAEQSFRQVEKFPAASGEQLYSALLGRANTSHLRTDPDLDAAAAHYERLHELGTETARKQALLGLGTVALAAGRAEDGREKLDELRRSYPDALEADEATIHLAKSFVSVRADEGEQFVPPRGSEVRHGIQILENRLEAHPDGPLAAVMHLLLASQYVESGEYETATTHLQAAFHKGITSQKARGDVLWQIARIAEKELADYDTAEQYYAQFVRDYQRNSLFYVARQGLERVRALKARQEE